MSLTDWMMKKTVQAQQTLPNRFRDALKQDMEKYEKKHGRKPTVDEVMKEFEKNAFVVNLATQHLKLGMKDIRRIAEEVLNG
jgi:hypothetical protein